LAGRRDARERRLTDAAFPQNEIMLEALLPTDCFWRPCSDGRHLTLLPIIKEECRAAVAKNGHKTAECKTLWEKTTTEPVAFLSLGSACVGRLCLYKNHELDYYLM
jgi:hypothetical protein